MQGKPITVTQTHRHTDTMKQRAHYDPSRPGRFIFLRPQQRPFHLPTSSTTPPTRPVFLGGSPQGSSGGAMRQPLDLQNSLDRVQIRLLQNLPVYVCVYVCTFTHTHARAHTHARTHARARAHTHTHLAYDGATPVALTMQSTSVLCRISCADATRAGGCHPA